MSKLAASDAPLEEVHRIVGKNIAREIELGLESFDQQQIGAHFMCSTIIDLPFSSSALQWSRLRREIAVHTSNPPETVVNAYECASWGYSLRQALSRNLRKPYILCTIVDLNVFNFRFWERSPHWGESGFGVATVLLHCEPGAQDDIVLGVAKTTNSIAEFAVALRTVIKKRPGLKLAQPFFPKPVTELLYKLLPEADPLTDLHPRFGHCFGSDPWISILLDATTRKSPQRYLAASVALNGYWALAEIGVDETSRFTLTEEKNTCINA